MSYRGAGGGEKERRKVGVKHNNSLILPLSHKNSLLSSNKTLVPYMHH
jgi:hypothetical protein